MRKLKEFLKKFYWIRFLNLYLKQMYFRLFYSTTKAKEKYIKKQVKKYLGYDIDFNKEPETFNQKIQFRKLYDNNPLYSICADKYRVREYVKEKIGEEYLVPLYLVTDKLTEEQWEKLPNSFVAKPNHDSGTVKIIKDKNKVNKKKIIRELNMSLKFDYGVLSLEKYYSDIPRKIIIEKYLEDEIIDYKFLCFNGKVEMLFLCLNRNTIGLNVDFYSKEWEKLPFERHYKNSDKILEKPSNYEKMLEISEKLSKEFDFVRVDLYEINNKVYFGELTFCPGNGLEEFTPEEWDYKLGKLWK